MDEYPTRYIIHVYFGYKRMGCEMCSYFYINTCTYMCISSTDKISCIGHINVERYIRTEQKEYLFLIS